MIVYYLVTGKAQKGNFFVIFWPFFTIFGR